MPTIKIKIKHLLIIIALVPLLLFTIPYGYLFYADRISDSNSSAATLMYKKYINAPPFLGKKDHAMFSLALKTFYIKGGSYYEKLLTDGTTLNSTYISKEMLATTISLYKNILKNHKKSPYYEKSYNNLLYIYTYAANVKAMETLIAEGETSNKKPVQLMSAQYKLYYKLATKQYSDVLNLGNKFLKEFGDDGDLYKLMADACLLNKNFDGAINYYSKAAGCNNRNYDTSTYTLFQDGIYNEQISLIKALKASSNTNSLVNGRVTILGKGVPFAHVYLKKLSDNSMFSGDEREPSFGITDFNGNYTIKGAPSGSYKLMLVIPGFLLNDTVLSENATSNITINKASSTTYDFNFVKPVKLRTGHNLKPDKGYVKLSWEPVQNAAFYNIHAILFSNPLKPDGNSTWVVISDEITSDNYRLDLNAVNIKPTGYSISDNGLINPQAYLGTFYPGCSVPIFVNAYDKKGLLLTSSISKVVLYNELPIITVNNSGLTKGEGLILEGKPEEAKKVLQEELKLRPNNIKLMNILSNLYTNGTRFYYKSNKKAIGQDLNRAINLNNKLYKLTKNPEYIRKNTLIYQYELKDYKGLLKNYGKLPVSMLTVSDYITLGEINLLLGKFEEAQQKFDMMFGAMKFPTSASLNPILLALYNKDFKGALSALEKTTLRLYRVSTAKLDDDIRTIETSHLSKAEYESFKKVLRMILVGNLKNTTSVEYKELMLKINNPQLTDIITQALYYHSIY